MTVRFIKLIFFSLILLSLTSCGYHLRAQSQLPPQLRTLYFQSQNPYAIFETQLRQTLQSTGVQIVKSPQAAPITLNILSTSFGYTTTTIGPTSQSRVYTFVYTVSFSLINSANGSTVYGPQTITTSSNLTLTADQLLQSNGQLNLLQQNMARDLVTRIYNILSSQSVREALAPKNNKTVKS